VLLQAGPLRLVFREGVFRYIRMGKLEILRALYVAVRDENWHTIPGVLSNLDLRSGSDSFRLTYDCTHRHRDIDFRWSADVSGTADGRIAWKMEGQAFSSFLKNRIGICVLHPIAECAGQPCLIAHADGSKEWSQFPRMIAPHQPFLDVMEMSYQVAPGLDAQIAFSGEGFETEDQRNWTDASFKTYSTPLAAPFPVRIEKGTTVNQSVILSLRGVLSQCTAVPHAEGEVTVTLRPEMRTRLPHIGLKDAGMAHPLSELSIRRLESLQLHHLSVGLKAGEECTEEGFWKAASLAARLHLPLEVALASDLDSAQLKRILSEIGERHVPVFQWLADVQMQLHPQPSERSELEAIAPVALGAGDNFAELNRNRPNPPVAGGVWFSLNPQVHATDDTTLIENLAAQSDVLQSIAEWMGEIPITVSPISLKPRWALAPGLDVSPSSQDRLPPDVDLRQRSLLGAGWTLGSIKHLAEGGAASLTCYETCGWKGVMETSDGSPAPSLFPSVPDTVFPLYHVFSALAPFKDGQAVCSESSQPLQADAIAVVHADRLRVMVANFTGAPVGIALALAGLATHVELRKIDEDNVERVLLHPELLFLEEGRVLLHRDGAVRLQLKPFGMAIVDATLSSPLPAIESRSIGRRQ